MYKSLGSLVQAHRVVDFGLDVLFHEAGMPADGLPLPVVYQLEPSDPIQPQSLVLKLLISRNGLWRVDVTVHIMDGTIKTQHYLFTELRLSFPPFAASH